MPQPATMRLFARQAATLLVALALSLAAAEKTSGISRIRLQKITEIIRRYHQAGENLANPDVKAAIFQEVAEQYALEPQGNPTRTSTRDIAKIIREKVAEKYPDDLKTVEAKAKAEAEPMFQMHKPLDYVAVRYEQGRKTFDVEGIFYGYGKGGNSVNIGSQIVPIFDLLPEYRVRFDRTFNEIQKKDHIQERIRSYFAKKTLYSGELFNEIRDQATRENEKEGWIYAWNDWRSPRDVTEQIIRGIVTNTDIADTPPEVKPGDTPPEVKPGDTPPEVKPADTLQQRLVEARSKAEQKKIIIANTFTGVDADQGYDLALWGMTREEVALLFHPHIPLDSKSSLESIKPAQGVIESVQLFFLNDLFYMVSVNFHVAHGEPLQMAWRKMGESYGESQEEIAANQRYAILRKHGDNILQAMEARPTLCQQRNPPEDHDYEEVSAGEGDARKVVGRVCKKCGMPEPPEIPRESTFTWAGEVTTAVLNVRLNLDHSGYELFRLTKSNPKLKERIEADIAQERLRKAEEERKKREEQFREPIKF